MLTICDCAQSVSSGSLDCMVRLSRTWTVSLQYPSAAAIAICRSWALMAEVVTVVLPPAGRDDIGMHPIPPPQASNSRIDATPAMRDVQDLSRMSATFMHHYGARGPTPSRTRAN